MLSFRTRKRFIKAVFWVLTITLGAGLIGSSLVWTAPDKAVDKITEPQASMETQINQAFAKRDTVTLLAIGRECLDQGDTRRAIEVYRKVLQLAPGNAGARLGLVEAYFMNNDYDLALEEVETVLKQNPNHQKALYYRGLIRGFGKKDYGGAVADLERFVALAGSGQEVEEAKSLIEEWRAKQ